MKGLRIQAPMRFFFAVTGTMIWLGIWLTGFAAVSGILYLPAVFFVFAASAGICPGIIVSNWLFRKKAA